MQHKLITKAQAAKLHKNWQANDAQGGGIDHKPVVKLFMPDGAATWLITELAPDGTMFGLCDLGHGSPELGYVNLFELQSIRGRFGLKIERDAWFEADKPISAYADEARASGRIAA